MRKIRVLVVDDSALMRRVLTDLLSRDEQIDVVDTAADPLIAREKIKRLDPDVITLDVEMPNMGGLDFLERLMRLRPMPVVMFSSLTSQGAGESIRALALGAIDFVEKPSSGTAEDWENLAGSLISKIKLAAGAHMPAIVPGDVPAPRGPLSSWDNSPLDRIVAIGASTGGVQALQTVLRGLPAHAPPILIAQHMPENFTRSFAKRLDNLCDMAVAEARDGDALVSGHVYLAPGDRHILLERRAGGYACRLRGGAEHNGHMPSIDLMFQSVAAVAGSAAMGIVLTGMGKDGAAGLLQIHEAGGVTAAQDEATSLIYGMPKAAAAIGAAQYELPIDEISAFILSPRRTLRQRSKPEGVRA